MKTKIMNSKAREAFQMP